MKKQILSSLILAGSLVVAVSAHAEEKNQSANTSTVKVTDVQKKDEQTNGDLDNEITNAKMRADSGSKSIWSVSTSWAYNGGNLEKPFGAERPNYAGEAGTQPATNLVGSVGINYRLDKNSALNFSTGLSLYTPFQNNWEETSNQNGNRQFSIATPSLGYSRSFRAMGIQQAFSSSASYATDAYDVDTLKLLGSLSVGHTLLFEIPNSNWQPGVAFDVTYNGYTEGADNVDTIQNRGTDVHGGGRTDWVLGFYPFVEYAFNDMFSFRTVFRPFIFSHFRSDDGSEWLRSLYTQSVGIGIAVTRDIYLYPNMQFAPEYFTADKTNVGMSATINVF
ncbi:hypothetical protein [Bdellovibrio sp. KM01]|uniref:hypothetical protein n=1 Tax=Bdellovibrio sp. KM01 TaxID=2748865 RepID=UPI0015EAD363|nr:hypothetical protein [Bdellovibrio sp. KM01]QLY27211.1 hypothetical protein HW988_09590 [Bdellovibrio sp. KM01]